MFFVAGRLAATETVDELTTPFFELFVIHLAAEDVVRNIVSEICHLAGRARGAPSEGQVDTERTLGLEGRVPHLEGKVAVMNPEEEQLFERGCARRARDARRDS